MYMYALIMEVRFLDTCMHVCIHDVYIYIDICLDTAHGIHICTYTYIYAYIHVYIYTYTFCFGTSSRQLPLPRRREGRFGSDILRDLGMGGSGHRGRSIDVNVHMRRVIGTSTLADVWDYAEEREITVENVCINGCVYILCFTQTSIHACIDVQVHRGA